MIHPGVAGCEHVVVGPGNAEGAAVASLRRGVFAELDDIDRVQR